MLSSADSLQPWWPWLAGAAFLAALVYAAWHAPWRRLYRPEQQHLLFGSIVAAMLLWRLNASVLADLDLHFVGAAALALMFGPHFAFLVLAAALAGMTILGDSGLEMLGLKGLLAVGLPVTAMALMARMPAVPRHPAARVFGHGLVGGLLGILLAGTAAMVVLVASGEYRMSFLVREYFPFLCLLAWSEAVLTGVVLFLLAIERPHWLGGLAMKPPAADRRQHPR